MTQIRCVWENASSTISIYTISYNNKNYKKRTTLHSQTTVFFFKKRKFLVFFVLHFILLLLLFHFSSFSSTWSKWNNIFITLTGADFSIVYRFKIKIKNEKHTKNSSENIRHTNRKKNKERPPLQTKREKKKRNTNLCEWINFKQLTPTRARIFG